MSGMPEGQELARLFRYVDASQLPSPSVVSYLYPETNVLLINKELFETLTPGQKRRVWGTDEVLIELVHRRSDYLA